MFLNKLIPLIVVLMHTFVVAMQRPPLDKKRYNSEVNTNGVGVIKQDGVDRKRIKKTVSFERLLTIDIAKANAVAELDIPTSSSTSSMSSFFSEATDQEASSVAGSLPEDSFLPAVLSNGRPSCVSIASEASEGSEADATPSYSSLHAILDALYSTDGKRVFNVCDEVRNCIEAVNSEDRKALLEEVTVRQAKSFVIGGETPLCRACKYGLVELVHLLIAYDANVNCQDPVTRGSLLYGLCGSTSSIEIIKALLAAGADVHYSYTTGAKPLQVASLFRRADIVELLLQHGARVNDLDGFGSTALCDAGLTLNYEICDILLKAEANPNIMIAAEQNKVSLLHGIMRQINQLFRGTGRANTAELAEKHVQTVLNKLKKHISLIKLFVKYGADITVLDSEGRSVFDYLNSLCEVTALYMPSDRQQAFKAMLQIFWQKEVVGQPSDSAV